MEYTNITHGYKIRDEIRPHCEDCDQEVFNGLRRIYRITRKSLGDDKEEAERLIKYLKQTGHIVMKK
jgi:hypothetical protein